MAERREPHWLVPVVVALALALLVAWLGLNDWRFPFVNSQSSESVATGQTPSEEPDSHEIKQLTEYERLSVDSLSGPTRALLTTPPRDGDFNCLAETNSFLDDERDFVWIKDVQAHENRPWHGDGLQVEDGHIYTLAIYPINCGLATADPDDGILRDATVRIDVPSRADTSMRVGAVLRSTHLDHPVWDGVLLRGVRPFTVTPIPGSVQYMSSFIGQSDGKRLPDAVFHIAQLIGDKGQDGVLRACFKPGDTEAPSCHILIYAQVQVQMP